MKNGNGHAPVYEFAGLDEWRTDPQRCRDGVPFDMGDGCALIVRRANLYDRAVQVHFDNIDSKDQHAVQEVFARVIIADWRGIVDKSGAPVPYSVDACLALFAYANELWEQVQRFAMNRANFRFLQAQADADAVKTSRDGEAVQAPTANS